MTLSARDYLPEIFPPAGQPSASSPGMSSPGTARVEGRVLKVRLGHNPNSSGIGAVALVFLWGTLTAGTIITLTSSFLLARMARETDSGAAEGGPSGENDGGAA